MNSSYFSIGYVEARTKFISEVEAFCRRLERSRQKATGVNAVNLGSRHIASVCSASCGTSFAGAFPSRFELVCAHYSPFDLKSMALATGVQMDSFQVLSARDSELFVDSLYVPAQKNQNNLLVLISGVHGVEAYAGSAIQQLFLREFHDRFPSDETGVLLVHSLNPFGFKYHRRSTENNVNLNRNFSVNHDLFNIQNSDYRRLSSLLTPEGPLGNYGMSFFGNVAQVLGFLARREFTADEFIRGFAQGQFEFPRGLEYGGAKPEPQTQYLIDLLRNKFKDYRRIVLFDLHTGLGEKYELHLIPGSNSMSQNEELRTQLFKLQQDRNLYRYTPGDVKGFYHVYGDLLDVLPDLISSEQKLVAFTVEFGTLGSGVWSKLKTLQALIAENQGFHHGYKNAGCRARAEKAFVEAFFPSEARWRENVVGRSRELLRRILDRMKSAGD